MQNAQKIAAAISVEEMEAKRQAHEASRHSLALEGLDGFLSTEAEKRSQAWIRDEITLEEAIAETLQTIHAKTVSNLGKSGRRSTPMGLCPSGSAFPRL